MCFVAVVNKLDTPSEASCQKDSGVELLLKMTNHKKKIPGVGTGLCRNLTCLGNLSSVKYIFVGVAKNMCGVKYYKSSDMLFEG